MSCDTGRRGAAAAICAIALLLGAADAGAQEGLYGPPPPSGAAFVRVVHGAPDAPTFRIDLGTTRYGQVAFGQLTPYRPVLEGVYILNGAGAELALVPRSGRYYTVAFAAAGATVFEDSRHTDPARAQLVVFNLAAGGEVGLAARRADTGSGQPLQVIPAVAAGGARAVAVNAVPVHLLLVQADAVLAEIGDPGLQRGQSYSVFYLGALSGSGSDAAAPSAGDGDAAQFLLHAATVAVE